MQTIKSTKKVKAVKSLINDNKLLVKVSNVCYGHIEGNTFIQRTNATSIVGHLLDVFVTKNNLTHKEI